MRNSKIFIFEGQQMHSNEYSLTKLILISNLKIVLNNFDL